MITGTEEGGHIASRFRWQCTTNHRRSLSGSVLKIDALCRSGYHCHWFDKGGKLSEYHPTMGHDPAKLVCLAGHVEARFC